MGWQDRDYHRYDARSMFTSRFTGMSVVTWLIVINAVVTVWDGIFATSTRGNALAIAPLAYFSVEKAIHHLQLWRWVTYQFVHADFFHVFFNMLVLFFLGPLMERWWGSRRFLVFYLLCGVSGAFVTVLLGTISGLLIFSEKVWLVGASGSIFGILIACAVLYPKQRVMLIFPPIPMTMRTLALALLVIAVLRILAGAHDAGGEAAHLGGAALGFVLVHNPSWLNWAERTRLQFNRSPSRWQQKQQEVKQDFVEVDRILTKVKEHGLHSLTRRETRTLQRATERQRRPR